MSHIVTTARDAVDNIFRFPRELSSSPELQDRLSYARAWYAAENHDGSWSFGPSKFVGYQGMTAAEYLDDQPRNGRRTETQLAMWFEVVEESSELYDFLSAQLAIFLSSYGKLPSTKSRINVARRAVDTAANGMELEGRVVELMVAVARTLSPASLQRLRHLI